MQWCRFCGKLIDTGRPYDPGELWICKECQAEHEKQNEKVAQYILNWLNSESGGPTTE